MDDFGAPAFLGRHYLVVDVPAIEAVVELVSVGAIEGASMMMVRVEVAVRPDWSVTTFAGFD